jgi:hypothetical protein
LVEDFKEFVMCLYNMMLPKFEVMHDNFNMWPSKLAVVVFPTRYEFGWASIIHIKDFRRFPQSLL